MSENNTYYQTIFQHLQTIEEMYDTFDNYLDIECLGIDLESSYDFDIEGLLEESATTPSSTLNQPLNANVNDSMKLHLVKKRDTHLIDAEFTFIENSSRINLAVDCYATMIMATVGIILNTAGIYGLLKKDGLRTMFSLLLSAILICDST